MVDVFGKLQLLVQRGGSLTLTPTTLLKHEKSATTPSADTLNGL